MDASHRVHTKGVVRQRAFYQEDVNGEKLTVKKKNGGFLAPIFSRFGADFFHGFLVPNFSRFTPIFHGL